MKYILKADLDRVKDKEKLYNGFVSNVEYGTWVHGTIEDENGNVLGSHTSSTLDWLEHDLLRHVPFNKDIDTYEKNW